MEHKTLPSFSFSVERAHGLPPTVADATRRTCDFCRVGSDDVDRGYGGRRDVGRNSSRRSEIRSRHVVETVSGQIQPLEDLETGEGPRRQSADAVVRQIEFSQRPEADQRVVGDRRQLVAAEIEVTEPMKDALERLRTAWNPQGRPGTIKDGLEPPRTPWNP